MRLEGWNHVPEGYGASFDVVTFAGQTADDELPLWVLVRQPLRHMNFPAAPVDPGGPGSYKG